MCAHVYPQLLVLLWRVGGRQVSAQIWGLGSNQRPYLLAITTGVCRRPSPNLHPGCPFPAPSSFEPVCGYVSTSAKST